MPCTLTVGKSIVTGISGDLVDAQRTDVIKGEPPVISEEKLVVHNTYADIVKKRSPRHVSFESGKSKRSKVATLLTLKN